MLNPHDPYLQDVFDQVCQDQHATALMSGNPFHGNVPPVGELPTLAPGRIPIAALPTGDVLSIDVMDLTRNLTAVGPSGSGKTNWLRVLIAAALRCGNLVVSFDRKDGELADCQSLTASGLPVLVLRWSELKLAMLQPAQGMSVVGFSNTLVRLLATQLNLFASRRLMIETLSTLYKRPRPRGTWPRLSEWTEMIEAIHVSAASRLGQYKEASLFALKQIQIELGKVVNYAASDMLERLFAWQGCVVIITSGLSVEMQSLLASLLMSQVYQSRERLNPDLLRPIVFVLDDALPLARGGATGEAEGGINPISEWAFMGRSRRMGIVTASQNFGLLSPALRMNSHALLCFGSYGRDADEVAKHMSLTPEQKAMLPFLQPGEVIARVPPWPAQYGRVPEVR